MKNTATLPGTWFDWLCEHCEGSSGHGGNLTGMRRLYWHDAPVIRCNGYLFKMNYNDFIYCTTGRRPTA